jgi:hypothetical protein
MPTKRLREGNLAVWQVVFGPLRYVIVDPHGNIAWRQHRRGWLEHATFRTRGAAYRCLYRETNDDRYQVVRISKRVYLDAGLETDDYEPDES